MHQILSHKEICLQYLPKLYWHLWKTHRLSLPHQLVRWVQVGQMAGKPKSRNCPYDIPACCTLIHLQWSSKWVESSFTTTVEVICQIMYSTQKLYAQNLSWNCFSDSRNCSSSDGSAARPPFHPSIPCFATLVGDLTLCPWTPLGTPSRDSRPVRAPGL